MKKLYNLYCDKEIDNKTFNFVIEARDRRKYHLTKCEYKESIEGYSPFGERKSKNAEEYLDTAFTQEEVFETIEFLKQKDIENIKVCEVDLPIKEYMGKYIVGLNNNSKVATFKTPHLNYDLLLHGEEDEDKPF